MKRLLVPTDFSACASYAMNVALSLAEKNRAELHMYTQLDIQEDWDKMTTHEQAEFREDQQKIKNAKTLLKEWKHKAIVRGIEVKISWSGGNLIEQIENYVTKNEIDFIIMGSYGASGKNEYFIGSNTQKVVRTVHCPVLIIKEEMNHFDFKKVVFASNFDASEMKAFQYLLSFVEVFQPEIHLVAINTNSWFGQPYVLMKEAMDDFAALCKGLKCEIHFYRDWSVDAGIRHLSEEIGADLVAIANQHRPPLLRIFTGSNVEALVNHAQMPVLSIDFPKAAVMAKN